MRTRRIKTESSSSSFELSISDLMAALCSIFLLFLVVTVIKLNQQKAEYTAKNGVAENYRSMQSSLYQDLQEEFQENLSEWNIEITPDLTFHFKDADTLFESEKSDLQWRFTEILDNLFPRLVKVISSPKYVNEIQEIRIEGHTAKNPNLSLADDYRTGMELSQQRTTAVLLYCIENTKLPFEKIQGEDSLEWVRKRIVAIGYSNSIPIASNFTKEEKKMNRRVEIKIKTKAEDAITEIQNLGK